MSENRLLILNRRLLWFVPYFNYVILTLNSFSKVLTAILDQNFKVSDITQEAGGIFLISYISQQSNGVGAINQLPTAVRGCGERVHTRDLGQCRQLFQQAPRENPGVCQEAADSKDFTNSSYYRRSTAWTINIGSHAPHSHLLLLPKPTAFQCILKDWGGGFPSGSGQHRRWIYCIYFL